jgi:integrase
MTRQKTRMGSAVQRRRSFMAQPFKHPTSGIYYLRRKVPPGLQDALGREYKKSLGTRDPAEAKGLFAQEWANSEGPFAIARAQSEGGGALTGRDTQVLAGRWFRDELAKVDASGDYSRWLATATATVVEQGDYYEEHRPMVTLADALADEGEELVADVHGHIARVLKAHNIPAPKAGTKAHDALIGAFSEHFFKLSEIALARHEGNWHAALPTLVDQPLSVEAGKASKLKAKKLLDVFEEYAKGRLLTEGEKNRGVLSTITEYRALMLQFVQLCGDLPITDITRAVIRDYRALVAQLPVKGEGIRKLNAPQLIAKAKAEGLPCITPATISNKLRAVSSVMSYAVRMEYIKQNPIIEGGFLRERAMAKRRAAIKERNYYDSEELTAIFASPIYSAATWTPPRADFGRAWYWMPLLMYYTGARLEELAQLELRDVRREASGPYLSILNTEGEEDGERGVKNAGSRRNIPLHPDLISLGLLAYVESLPSESRLFPKLLKDPKGYFGTNFGRRWADYLRSTVKLKTTVSPSHGFRHTFKTLCRAARIPEDVQDAITGHAGGSAVARNYGAMPLSRKAEEIARFPSAPGLLRR